VCIWTWVLVKVGVLCVHESLWVGLLTLPTHWQEHIGNVLYGTYHQINAIAAMSLTWFFVLFAIHRLLHLEKLPLGAWNVYDPLSLAVLSCPWNPASWSRSSPPGQICSFWWRSGWGRLYLGKDYNLKKGCSTLTMRTDQLGTIPMYFNPILHTWFRDGCFTCDGFSTIQVFPLLLNIGMVI